MRSLRGWWRTVGNVVARRRFERELDAELAATVSELVAELRARGVAPREAHRQALVALGGVEQVKEEVRAARGGAWLERILGDARFAVRTLRRAKTYSLVATLTLAVGVGGTTALFSVLHSAFAPPPYPHGERLVHIWATWPGGAGNLGYPDYQALVEQNRSFARLAVYENWGGVALTGRPPPVRLATSFVSPEYLELLGARTARGRLFLPEESTPTHARNVVVLTDACWRRDLAADPGVVGRAVRLNGTNYTVIGVLAPGFHDLGTAEGDPPADVFLPVAAAPALLGQPPLTAPYQIYWALGLLRPGLSPAQAQANLDAVAAHLERADPVARAGYHLRLQPVAQRMSGPVRRPAVLLFAGALLILCLGCVNLASTTLVRLARRRGELAVRRALGASARRVAQQVLVEVALLAAVGAAGAVAVAFLLTRALSAWVRGAVAPLVDPRVDGATLACAAALAILAMALCGLAPALAGRRVELASTLRGAGWKGAATRQRSRAPLVVVEVALSMMLLVGAGLMTRSAVRLARGELGYDPRDLLTFRLNLSGERYADEAARVRFAAALDRRLRAVPGVRSVSLLGPSLLGNATWVMSVLPRERAGVRREDFVQAFRHSVNPGSLRGLGIALVNGREIDAHDGAAAPPVAVISADLARELWGTVDVVGRQLQRSEPALPPLTVVGVAADAQQRNRYSLGDIAAGIGPCGIGPQRDVYRPYAQTPSPSITVAVRLAGPAGPLTESVRLAVAQLDAELPLADVALQSDRLAAQERAPQAIVQLLAAYALFALFLSFLGLHGVIAQAVEQRRQEIGIRLALGARGAHVLRQFVGDGARLALLGIGCGAVGAIGLAHAMSSLLFGVEPLDAPTFAVVALALLLMALLASFLPVRWAMRSRAGVISL